MNGRTAAPTLETLLAEREWVGTLARVLAGNGADADDLEQEAWVAALRSPPERPGPVRGWFATVMRRRRLDAGRAAARRMARESAAARPEALPSAADSVARAETLRRVVEAVLSLDEPGRSTVILRYFDGLPPREIAARTGVPVETVHTRLRRALDVLRERLGEDGENRRAWAFLVPAAAILAVAAAGAFLLRSDPSPAPVPAVASVPPPAVVEEPPPAPAPAPAPAAAPPPKEEKPAGSLVLRARAEPASPRFREPMRLVATFENGGKEEVSIFRPDITITAAFPRWTLRDAAGREFHPDPEWIGQSMWEKGPRGEILRIAPGASRTVETPLDLVVPAEGGGAKEALRPGTYLVRAAYSRADTKVPWSEEFGKPDIRKEVEGLWIGTLEAEPFEVRILPSEDPSIALSVPETIVPGKPCPVEVSLENTASTAMVLKGRVLLRSIQKGTGTLDEAVLNPDGAEELRVEPESTLVLKADLARLPGDWLDRTALLLTATLDFAEEGREDPASDLVIRRVEPLPAAPGLRLSAGVQEPGKLLVTLRNDGTETVRVPGGFAWPARLQVEFRHPDGGIVIAHEDGGRSTVTAHVLAGTVPGKPRALGPDDFTDLEPGHVLAGIVDLRGEGMPGVRPGPYDVLVRWRNVESGLRAGAGVAPVVVGTVAAPAVRVDLPEK